MFPRPVWVLFIGTLINRFGGFVLVFLILYLTRNGYSPAQAGLAVSAYGIGAVAASMVGGQLADRIGRRNTIALSMFAGAAAILALQQAHGLVSIVGWTALVGLTAEAYRPAASALLADLTLPAQRVTAFAWYRMAINLGAAIGPVRSASAALGGILERTDEVLRRWPVAGLLLLLLAIAFGALMELRR